MTSPSAGPKVLANFGPQQTNGAVTEVLGVLSTDQDGISDVRISYRSIFSDGSGGRSILYHCNLIRIAGVYTAGAITPVDSVAVGAAIGATALTLNAIAAIGGAPAGVQVVAHGVAVETIYHFAVCESFGP
jgi:hypothetical protein